MTTRLRASLSSPVFPVSNLYQYLTGSWNVARTLSCTHSSGINGEFVGTAVFSPATSPIAAIGQELKIEQGYDRKDLEYIEEGHVSLAAHSGPATRRYFFTFPKTVSEADVLFDDRRHFYPLDLRSGSAEEVVHLCGDDVYTGVFVVHSEDKWSSEWIVVGPHKRQTITTEYARSS